MENWEYESSYTIFHIILFIDSFFKFLWNREDRNGETKFHRPEKIYFHLPITYISGITRDIMLHKMASYAAEHTLLITRTHKGNGHKVVADKNVSP